MDDNEAEYLRQQNRELRQANRRWKVLALLSWSVLAILLLVGGGTVLTGGFLLTERMRVEEMRAREAEMEARDQAEQARQAEMEARKQAEENARQAKEAEKRAGPDKR
jgi:hypothetical protein